MFKYYEELGLESNHLYNTDLVDLELDIFGCESAADLTLSVLEYTLDNEIAALGFNKVLIAETVMGIEGVDFSDVLSELGIESIADTVKGGWAKFKMLIKRIVDTLLMFLNKFKALFAVNEKLYKKIFVKSKEIHDKQLALIKRGNIKFKKDKVESPIKGLCEGVMQLYRDNTGIFKVLLTGDSETLKDIKTVEDFIINIKKIDIQQHGSKFGENIGDRDSIQLKKEYSNMYKESLEVYSKKEEIESKLFMRKCCTAIEDIFVNTEIIIDKRNFERINESIKVMTNIKKQVDSLTDEDAEKYFGNNTKLKEQVIKLASSISTKYSNLLVIETEGAKAYANVCNLVFKENTELFKLVQSK